MTPTAGPVAAVVAELSHRITAHAGGLELDGVAPDGTVRVRFTGLCTGCPYRPLTMAGTVRPALLQVQGVTAVEAAGSRISAEAEARLAALLDPGTDRAPIPPGVSGG
jgi:Fe-S cluster biogenesis protein NfuA